MAEEHAHAHAEVVPISPEMPSYKQVMPSDVVDYIVRAVDHEQFVQLLRQTLPAWLDGIVKGIIIERQEMIIASLSAGKQEERARSEDPEED